MKTEVIITAKMAPKCHLHLTSNLCEMPGRSEREIACSSPYAGFLLCPSAWVRVIFIALLCYESNCVQCE